MMDWVNKCQRFEVLGKPLLQIYAGLAKQAEISLAIGEPDDDPAPEVISMIRNRLDVPHHAGYTAAAGNPLLLKRVALAFQDIGLSHVRAESVLTSHGAKLLISVAIATISLPGDRIIWFGPGYTYGRAAKLLDRLPIMVETNTAFDPDFRELQSALDQAKVQDHLGALIVNNPVNPTGRVWSRETLQQLALLARQFDVPVIADETYGGLIFPPAEFVPFATLDGMEERTITICSGSKEMCMPGYRFGYLAGPLVAIEAMRTVLGDCVGCTNVLTQAGAEEGLRYRRLYASRQIPSLLRKKEMVENWCVRHGLAVAPMEGAYYAFVDFQKALAKLGLSDTVELADLLLRQGDVGIIPGNAFTDTFSNCSSWARISIAGEASELAEGLERIGKVINN